MALFTLKLEQRYHLEPPSTFGTFIVLKSKDRIVIYSTVTIPRDIAEEHRSYGPTVYPFKAYRLLADLLDLALCVVVPMGK